MTDLFSETVSCGGGVLTEKRNGGVVTKTLKESDLNSDSFLVLNWECDEIRSSSSLILIISKHPSGNGSGTVI